MRFPIVVAVGSVVRFVTGLLGNSGDGVSLLPIEDNNCPFDDILWESLFNSTLSSDAIELATEGFLLFVFKRRVFSRRL